MGIIKNIIDGTNKLKEMQSDRGSLSHKEWFAKYGIPSFPKASKGSVASKIPACKGGNCINKAHRHTR